MTATGPKLAGGTGNVWTLVALVYVYYIFLYVKLEIFILLTYLFRSLVGQDYLVGLEDVVKAGLEDLVKTGAGQEDLVEKWITI